MEVIFVEGSPAFNFADAVSLRSQHNACVLSGNRLVSVTP